MGEAQNLHFISKELTSGVPSRTTSRRKRALKNHPEGRDRAGLERIVRGKDGSILEKTMS